MEMLDRFEGINVRSLLVELMFKLYLRALRERNISWEFIELNVSFRISSFHMEL